MEERSTRNIAFEKCMMEKSFGVVHMYNESGSNDMHIHDCFEIYLSLSDGKHMLIDSDFYSIQAGDLFFINHFESHYLNLVKDNIHEYIVIYLHPEFLLKNSTMATDLSMLFSLDENRDNRKIHLSKEEQDRFIELIGKMQTSSEFAQDILEKAAMLEMLGMLINLKNKKGTQTITNSSLKINHQVNDILTYINEHITETISIDSLANTFYLSESYICRVFKSITGTTINKYITARRISMAKELLSQGMSVTDTCIATGFTEYSNFFKAFTKHVGISPKKYSSNFSQKKK